jgi:peptide deformylase
VQRSIVRLGHPALRFPAAEVKVEELSAADLRSLVLDLRETLAGTRAGILTAPQIGLELQVLAFRPAIAADEAASEIRIVVNPMLEPEHGDLIHDWEECLSIPGLRGLVPRYPRVRLRGVDEQGAPVDLVAEGLESRILQHAHDHLGGLVFLDRMRDLRSLAFEEEWRQYLREAAPGGEDTSGWCGDG